MGLYLILIEVMYNTTTNLALYLFVEMSQLKSPLTWNGVSSLFILLSVINGIFWWKLLRVIFGGSSSVLEILLVGVNWWVHFTWGMAIEKRLYLPYVCWFSVCCMYTVFLSSSFFLFCDFLSSTIVKMVDFLFSFVPRFQNCEIFT